MKLTFAELSTILAQIEACLNSRPLVPLNTSDGGIEALIQGSPQGFRVEWQLLIVIIINDIHNFNDIHAWVLCKPSCTCVNSI